MSLTPSHGPFFGVVTGTRYLGVSDILEGLVQGCGVLCVYV